MTVQEDYTSREVDITTSGTVLTAVYDCTWTDWDSDIVNMPIIGDYWPYESRLDMICSHIKVRAKDNVNCRVFATFSTEAYEARVARENQAASWREAINIDWTEQQGTTYWDQSSGMYKDWGSKWASDISAVTGSDFSASQAPYLAVFVPKMHLTTTVYGNKSYIKRMYDNIGKINSSDFIDYFNATQAVAQPNHDDDVAGETDKEKWMFAGCQMERISATNWQYNLHFLHCGTSSEHGNYASEASIGYRSWNYQHGRRFNLYATADFTNLMEGMDLIEPELESRLHYG